MSSIKRNRVLWPLALAALVAAAAIVTLWRATPGSAIEVHWKPAPLVGMTEGQILRISVAYVKGFDPQPDPPGCRLQAGFVDRDGNAIGNPMIFELRPGASRSFDHVAIGNPNIRQYVRPVVVDLDPRAECPLRKPISPVEIRAGTERPTRTLGGAPMCARAPGNTVGS